MIYDALIVGAGPAGSTAARLLAKAGWSVGLVEKSVFPRRKVCGEYISATSLPLLDLADGGGGFFSRAGPEIRRVALFCTAAEIVSAMPQARSGALAWGRALGREHLDSLLRDGAVRAGARLFQPFRLVGLEQTQGAYLARIEGETGGQDLSARIVVSANGSWERGVLSLEAPPHRPGDLLAFKAHFHASDLPQDLIPLLMFPGGYGGMVSTDGGRMSLSCCIRRDRLADVRKAWPALSAGEAVLEHIRDHCQGARQALERAQLAGPFLSAGPIRPGIRRAYDGGLFRVGNAAGEAHPIIAEGISMAIQSSWLLCRRLIADPAAIVDERAARGLGAAYGRDWSAQFAPRVRAAALLAHLATRPATAALAASLAGRIPRVLTWGAILSGKAMSPPDTDLPPASRPAAARL